MPRGATLVDVGIGGGDGTTTSEPPCTITTGAAIAPSVVFWVEYDRETGRLTFTLLTVWWRSDVQGPE